MISPDTSSTMQTYTYPDTLEIQPLERAPDVTIAVPGSKSITNRALILAALANGDSMLHGALEAEDTRVMIASLNRLGIPARWEQAAQRGRAEGGAGDAPQTAAKRDSPPLEEGALFVRVEGQGGRVPAAQADLFVGNSGTSVRFLTALCALGTGPYTLDGVPRMRLRPQQDLLTALGALGVQANAINGDGCPPLRVQSQMGMRGGVTRLRAEASSQFLTALLMAAPYADADVTIEIEGALRPFYVEITRRMMAQWGVTLQSEHTERFHIPTGQRYAPQIAYHIEPDASSASYFFAAAAVTGGRVTVEGLSPAALQGDVRFATQVLRDMGCEVTHQTGGAQTTGSMTVTGPKGGRLRGGDWDMSAISDTALTLAAIAPFADSPTTVRGIAHSRHQECDRVSAVCAELTRLGVRVEEHADGYTIYPINHPTTNHPAAAITPATVQTYHDHRVAMSFALVGLKAPGVTIADPGCVAKTFPGYWQALEELR